MKVYLHIGLHKTGTTYLQLNVFPLLDGFHPVMLPPWRLLTKENLTDTELQQYKAEILKDWDGNKKIIISNEFFSGKIEAFTKQETLIIFNNLQRLFPDAEILLVLRSPKGYFKSLYNFRLVTRGFCPFSMEQYFEKKRQFLVEKFDYIFLQNELKKRFQSIHAVKYETVKTNSLYVSFICKALQVPAIDVAENVKSNTSSDKTAEINAHLWFNRFCLMFFLEWLPDGKLKNYLKSKYFKFKKTALAQKIIKAIQQLKWVNKPNVLSQEQENELAFFEKQYNELSL